MTHELLDTCSQVVDEGNRLRPMGMNMKIVEWISETSPQLGMRAELNRPVNSPRPLVVVCAYLNVEEEALGAFLFVRRDWEVDPLAHFVLESFKDYFQPLDGPRYLPYSHNYESRMGPTLKLHGV
jgi:hypothetical protein